MYVSPGGRGRMSTYPFITNNRKSAQLRMTRSRINAKEVLRKLSPSGSGTVVQKAWSDWSLGFRANIKATQNSMTDLEATGTTHCRQHGAEWRGLHTSRPSVTWRRITRRQACGQCAHDETIVTSISLETSFVSGHGLESCWRTVSLNMKERQRRCSQGADPSRTSTGSP